MKLLYSRVDGYSVGTQAFVDIVERTESIDGSTKAIGNATAVLLSPASSLIEFAARLCYDSTDKFNTNSAFLKGLLKSEHYDVFEHAAMSLSFHVDLHEDDNLYKDLFNLQRTFPYLRLDVKHATTGYIVRLIGNQRVFMEIGSLSIAEYTQAMGPNHFLWLIYDYLEEVGKYLRSTVLGRGSLVSGIANDILEIAEKFIDKPYNGSMEQTTETGAKITLLGLNVGDIPYDDQHTVYFIENVSRAMTHQHVRHRLISQSQASQRYIDYTKRNEPFIMPSRMSELSKELLTQHFEEVKDLYTELRADSRKEDARCVLPNATPTHIVSSAFARPGWDHYIKLRTASDAQEEIRLVAKAIEEIHFNVSTYRREFRNELSRSRNS